MHHSRDNGTRSTFASAWPWLVGAVFSMGCQPGAPFPESARTPAAPSASSAVSSAAAGEPLASAASRRDDALASRSSPDVGVISDDAALADAGEIERRLLRDLSYLASDELGGRGPFTEGLEKAADYLAQQFSACGLQTRRFGHPPFQVFRSSVKLALGDDNRLRFLGPDSATIELQFQRDFTPLSLSGAGEFAGPLAFVGHGITCPELGIDDYAGLDVRGKLVIVLRHAPPSLPTAAGARKSHDAKLVEHTYLARKVENAAGHGAAGVLLVTDAAHLAKRERLDADDDRPDADRAIELDPLLAFQVEGKLESRAIPVVHLRRAALARLLAAAGQPSLEELELATSPAEAETEGRRSAVDALVLAGWNGVGKASIERRTFTLKNVLAELPGRGRLADETVIVGAHYDHLGNGGISSLAPWTKAIHNGADDNASGSTTLLEVARQVVRRRQSEHARRLLFVAFSAEEMGLVGSERFVAAPPVPLDDVVSMVNLDMVGRLRSDRLTVSGIGTAQEFSPMVQRLTAAHDFRAKLDPSGLGPSDHATFAARGIPVLHFFTGLHEDYHRPSDDVERINIAGMRRISQLVAETVLELAQSESRPTPTRAGLDGLLADVRVSAVRRREPPDRGAESSADAAASSVNNRARSWGVKLSDEPGGEVAVRAIVPGSAAQRAGLRVGDVLRRVGAQDVASVSQAQAAARTAGDATTVPLRIVRGGTELEVELAW
ncbi:MAG: M28 family peptidase [Pirellulales bacterium]